MRAGLVGAFAVGFAIGALCIGVALWSTGRLRIAYLPPWQRAVVTAALPAQIDPTATAQLPAPPVPPPEPAPAPPSQGFAERAATEPATLHPSAHPPAELHLAMPIAGVDPNSLTDAFNETRNGHKHEALDIAAPRGTPVRAVAEGNVVKLFTSKQGGLTVYQFDDSQEHAFYYAHLDKYAPVLKEGMLLRKGDVLGYVGTTGNAPQDAPHLHFAVFKLGPDRDWWKGTPLDPLPMMK